MNRQSEIGNWQWCDLVASTTPRGLPTRGPRSAPGTDLICQSRYSDTRKFSGVFFPGILNSWSETERRMCLRVAVSIFQHAAITLEDRAGFDRKCGRRDVAFHDGP